jgi:hypothetical protein
MEGSGVYLFFAPIVSLLAESPCLEELDFTIAFDDLKVDGLNMNGWFRDPILSRAGLTLYALAPKLRSLTLRADWKKDLDLACKVLSCVCYPELVNLCLRNVPAPQGTKEKVEHELPTVTFCDVLQPVIVLFRGLVSFSADFTLGETGTEQLSDTIVVIGKNLRELILPFTDLKTIFEGYDEVNYMRMMPHLRRLVFGVGNELEPCLSFLEKWAALTVGQEERLREVVIWWKEVEEVDVHLIPEMKMRIERLCEGGLAVFLREYTDGDLNAALRSYHE